MQDFGIDKNLSERILDMEIDGLDPVRGSLEKVSQIKVIIQIYFIWLFENINIFTLSKFFNLYCSHNSEIYYWLFENKYFYCK